ncbi:MAG: SdiA-regulated domain-containing protein [Synechococcaceae cyanobacterium ELA739]
MAALNSIDLSKYVRIGRYDLPEPTRTSLPVGTPAWNLLAQEASAITYNKVTDTLFVLGDGGTAIVEISKTGQLISTMTLAKGNSPQGTEFYDPEGLTYVGNGVFVFVEERDRQVVQFTYQAGATLTRAAAKTVKLGTTIGNVGIEGITFDPSGNNAYILVKEVSPEGIFLSNIDFSQVPLGTISPGGGVISTNGSATTTNSTNLFDPVKAGLADFADVFALSNIPALNGTIYANDLLILSQESGKVVDISRDGTVRSSLILQLSPEDKASIADQTHEGLTMDANGNIYIVSENGGGDITRPQLWVYAPSAAVNKAPTDVVFINPVNTIFENIPIGDPYKLADIAIVDDGLGVNNLFLTGPDAANFQVDFSGLYLKPGTKLDFETKSRYDVTVAVDDTSVGATPDASRAFRLDLIDVVNENAALPSLAITEVSPWSSGNSLYKADWFEITNTGSTSIDLGGLRYDDDSNAFGSSVALKGVTSLAAGRSAVFIESVDNEAATISQLISAFKTDWFGTSVPAGFQIGTYSGAGVGLSTGGDAVNLFDQFGRLITGIKVPASTTYFTFANGAGAGATTPPTPTVSTLSSLGVNAFASVLPATGSTFEIGSPGVAFAPTYAFASPTYSAREGLNGAPSSATVRVTRSGDTSVPGSVVLQLGDGTAKGAAPAPAEGTSTGPSTKTTPYVLPATGSGVAIKSLLTVGDSIGGYTMAGIPDGLGAFDNGDGTFTLLMNQEIGNTLGAVRAHGGKGAFVSSWVIKKSDLSVVSGSDLIQNVFGWDATLQQSSSIANNAANSNGISFNRMCSADLAPVSAFYNAATGKGSQARLFLNGEEGGATGYALANVASGSSKGNSYVLGKFNPSTNGSGLTAVGGWENLLANWYAQDKTVVIGDNDGGTGVLNNALAVYVGTKTTTGTEADKAGLTNGVLKFVSVVGNAAEIIDATTRATGITNGTRFSLSSTASTTFSRPEDGAWDPLDPTKYYFVTTDRLDQASDGLGTQIGQTRLWRLTFDDITNPDAGGKIDLLVDGDVVNGKKVNMFDNITIDKFGHILLLEDVGNAAHNGKIWQYDIATDSLKQLAQHDPARFGDVGVAATSPFNQDEETSGIIDLQDILGPGSFAFVDQAHNPTDPITVEGGQLMLMFNPDTYKGYQPDFINTPVTVSFAAGDTSKDVAVPIVADSLIESPETVKLTLANPSPGSAVASPQPEATLAILDPAVVYNFGAASFNAVEPAAIGGLSNATVRVTRSGDTSVPGSVVLQLGDGTAKGAAPAPAEGTSTGPSTKTTPYVLPATGSGVAIKSLLTVGDSIGGYTMAGIPDGLGAFDNGDGTFTLLMNQEIGNTLGAVRAHGGKGAFVSSWVIKKSDLSVVSGSDLIQNVFGWDATLQQSSSIANNAANSNGISFNRMCSADLAPVSAFYNAATGKGSQARLFLNGEEGGATGYALANVASGSSKGNSYVLGKFNPSTNGSGLTAVGGWENLLANWYAQDKTVVIGDNDGGTGVLNNALAVYVGTKTTTGTEADKAGLTNGVLKFVSVVGNAAEIIDATTRATGITNGTRFSLSSTASTTFSRPEDGAWDPLDPTKYYFVTTDRLDQASDGLGTQIGQTRLWRLTFDDITNPDAGGKIDLLVDGDVVNGKKVNMFDNITIDKFGHILLLEDVGNAAHNGKIWQYDIATDSLKQLAQHDPARFGDVGVAATSPFNQDEETSGIIDLQDILGPGSFAFVDQAHNPTDPITVEGGQLMLMFNPDTYKGYQPDFINTPVTVSFAAGDTSKDVNVQILGDRRLEGAETVSLALANPSGPGLVGAAQPIATLRIADSTVGFNAVAAGNPTVNQATLWTRTFDKIDSTGRTGVAESVVVEVAADETFAKLVYTATGATSADTDYTVKFKAEGLIANATYFYRFKAKNGEISGVGRFHTLPNPSDAVALHLGHSGDVDGLMRPYALAAAIAAEKFDGFTFNGDTIYETASTGSPATPPTKDAENGTISQQALLDAYHRKYLENLLPAPGGTYPGLKDFFASTGITFSFDNHELGNKAFINGGAPKELGTTNANGSANPAFDVNTTGTYINDTQTFDTLLRAFNDYMPGTQSTINAPGDSRSNGELQYYGAQAWGKNALFINLDTRTFRDVRLNKAAGGDDTGSRADNPGRTLLGATQKAWLKQTLLDAKASGAVWKFINITDPIDMIGSYGSGDDGGKSWWGGYRAERNEILKFIADNGIRNVVFLASDDHTGRINDLTYMPNPSLDPTNPANYKVLEGVISIVDGPMGATGPDNVTDHSFANVKALVDALALKQKEAGLNPVGLDSTYRGLFNVYREGDSTASVALNPVDFASPDTNNYVSLDVAADGVLNIALRGINSYAQNSFPEPSSSNPLRTILSFSIDPNSVAPDVTLSLAADTGLNPNDRITGNGTVIVDGLQPNATFQYSIDNGSNWINGSGSSFRLEGNGSYSAIARQITSRNQVSSASAPLSFTIDPSAAGLRLAAGFAQLMYVANFGAPADPTGLAFWNSKLASGGISYAPLLGDGLTGAEQPNYNRIVNDFGNSTESVKLFAGLSNKEKVDQVYRQLFNRSADVDPITGKNYWQTKLDKGDVTLSQLAIEVALGARGIDLVEVSNKIRSAESFTNAIDAPNELAAYAGDTARSFGRSYEQPFGLTAAGPTVGNAALAQFLGGSTAFVL